MWSDTPQCGDGVRDDGGITDDVRVKPEILVYRRLERVWLPALVECVVCSSKHD